MEYVRQYLKENPKQSLVSEAAPEAQSLLLWAQKKRYITLSKAPNGALCFTEEDLEKAKMWREKDAD